MDKGCHESQKALSEHYSHRNGFTEIEALKWRIPSELFTNDSPSDLRVCYVKGTIETATVAWYRIAAEQGS